ncbi:lipid A deacylase LpxR family protein [Oleomonas cavernae]|uniref:Lipid A deacylase LpxR family protein n=1 Tax=Oleomonas cavernae TaxID=2320859 RepID=A0A418WDR4_9PROT|nr:lipid A deacylase LpxR family protein [Oleomonas cavernae]RJF88134.1 lipid A deacylase LpxR family protein [Oleomonas cavernae]
MPLCNKTGRRVALAAMVATGAWGSGAWAQDGTGTTPPPATPVPANAGWDAAPRDPNGTFSLQWENDIFAGTDRYYTNGLQLSWLSSSAPPATLGAVADAASYFLGADSQIRWGLSLGQTIYTPQDTDTRIPDPKDRPYAAFLFGAMSLVSYSEKELNTIELQVGVVGPSALGEEVQNNVHRVIKDDNAEGWDYQIKDEPGINLVFDRKWRAQSLLVTGWDLGVDVTPSVTVSLGNVSTYAGAGAMFRFGQNLSSDFGAPRIRPALAGSGFYDKRDGFGWYLFAGVEGRAVAIDKFLDANNYPGYAPDIDKKILVGDLQAGASVFVGSTRLTYSYVLRTKEFEGQSGNSEFGSVSLSWNF